MAYDSSKLSAAVDGWLEARCSIGYGTTYSADLLADFEDYIRETKALKASPGMVAFGRQLNKRKFGRCRRAGLTYWTGIEIKEQKIFSEPRRHESTIARIQSVEVARTRQEAEIRKEFIIDEEAERKRVRELMEKETRERIASAGLADEDL